MKVLIVSGTRERLTEDQLKMVWLEIRKRKPDMVIHGDCRTGVDQAADRVAYGIMILPMPAQWNRDGERAAGPIRNAVMVKLGQQLATCAHQVRWLAFPKGKSPGTRGFIAAAEKSGIDGEVIEL